MDRDAWNARYEAAELVWGAEPNRFVAEIVAPLPPGRALDLACGEGRNAAWLARRGWRVTAVDFSDVAVAKAAARAAADGIDVDWRVADLLAWAPPARAFDLVLVAYLQLPAPARDGVWARAAAAVAAGGTFLLVGHDRRNVTAGHGGPPDEAVCYTAPEVVAHLGDLAVVRAGEVERPVTLPDGASAVAIDCLVRAERPA